MENRREFIKKATLLSGALSLSSILPLSIQKALAINPELGTTFLDAEHIVFLMQENRSFDHCYGSLKGVRGFNDPRAIKLPNKLPVWLQSNQEGKTYAPFRLDIKDTKATWMSALPHGWNDQVDARNNGRYDRWLESKRSGNKAYSKIPLTMGYYNREDIPFYYALADAFTVCDHHFCSSLTGTSPNRAYFWTGKIRVDQHADSKAHVWNEDIDGSENVSWDTFPERLQQEGVDWKIYQNELSVATGLEEEEDSWLANFTDNTIECFKQYHVTLHPAHITYLKKLKVELSAALKLNAQDKKETKQKLAAVESELNRLEANSFNSLTEYQKELHRRAFVTNIQDPHYHTLKTLDYMSNGTKRSIQVPKGDVLKQFRSDVDSGNLPTVSWLVAPKNFSDHPSAPWYGAWYVSEVMDILTKNPAVWKKTIFILTYDENDGYFDHLPPFVAPDPTDPGSGTASRTLNTSVEYVRSDESGRASSIGLGYRVPMVIVSPWTKGGYVNSQIFDHTSCIQFVERFVSHKKGKTIEEENISNWRRSLCGDLTSAFRPYKGEKTIFPEPLDKDEVIESIHKAKFTALPSNFKALSQQEIEDVLANPARTSLLPKQEPGIKPANAIPYELRVDAELNTEKEELIVSFASGNNVFGKKAVGTAFNVYSGDRSWAFTVDAGDRLEYSWPLADFANGEYHLEIYGVNGFYREFKGSLLDPNVDMFLSYPLKKNSENELTGNVLLTIKRKNSNDKRELHFTLSDMAYKTPKRKLIMKENEKEIVSLVDLSLSYNWYDLYVIANDYESFSQRLAGHVETGKESFTDPLMGSVI